jgi:hypothetical protein
MASFRCVKYTYVLQARSIRNFVYNDSNGYVFWRKFYTTIRTFQYNMYNMFVSRATYVLRKLLVFWSSTNR